MNASDFGQAAPVDAPVAGTTADAPGASEPTATELFAEAFGGEREDAETAIPEEPPEPVEEEESEAPPPAETAPPQLTQEYIDAQVQARIAQAEQERAALDQRKQVEEALGRMNDAEYGQYMRQYSQQIAQYKSAQEAAMVNFYRESTTDVLTNVAELKQLTPEESAKINPKNASSYADLVSRMIDVAADKRASKLAEPKAKEMLEAWKATEQAKMAKKFKVVAEMSGTAGPAGNEPDFDKTSGREILAHAFSR